MSNAPTFAEVVKKLRGEERNQEQFAADLAAAGFKRITRQAISHWEQGRGCPDLADLNALAEAMQMTPGGRADLIDAASRYVPPKRRAHTDAEADDEPSDGATGAA